MQRSERNVVSDSVLKSGKYTVSTLPLTWPRVFMLWDKLKRFRTLFSDLTQGDLKNFVAYLLDKDTMWLEITEEGRLVGIVVLEGLSKVIDAEAHVLFMDRELMNKVPVCKAIIKWIFSMLPLQRLTVQIPTIYMGPVRLVNELGFRKEGKKRQAVLISGKWVDVFILGLTRPEASRL